MPAIPIPKSSTPGRNPGEGEGRLINACLEQEGDTNLWRRVPGLATFANTGLTGPRGFLASGTTLYGAWSGSVAVLNAAGAVTSISATLPGTDGVTWARNNRVTGSLSTPDIVACRTSGGVYLLSGGAMVAYPGPPVLPATVNSVAFLGGYLLLTNPDGRIFATGLNTTTVDPLSFATAESSPDGLVRGIVQSGRYLAMGTSTIEIWLNQGFQPFPLGRATTVIPVGLLTAMAVAGTAEEGWGLNPIFVASDGTVREIVGYDARVISTGPVERFIAASTTSTLEACVFTYRAQAHWALSSDVGTWVFDAVSRQWHERMSLGAVRWRASRSVRFAEKWLTGDTLTGSVLEVREGLRGEANSPLTWQLDTAALQNYPARIAMPAAYMHFTKASANVNVSWSHDGGGTWATPIAYSLSTADRYPVCQRRLGLSTQHGFRLRMTVSDDADFSFLGADVPAPEVRAP